LIPLIRSGGRAGLLGPLTHGGAQLAITGTIYAIRMANRAVIRMVNRNSPA